MGKRSAYPSMNLNITHRQEIPNAEEEDDKVVCDPISINGIENYDTEKDFDFSHESDTKFEVKTESGEPNTSNNGIANYDTEKYFDFSHESDTKFEVKLES